MLIDAVELLVRRDVDVTLSIAGGGALLESLATTLEPVFHRDFTLDVHSVYPSTPLQTAPSERRVKATLKHKPAVAETVFHIMLQNMAWVIILFYQFKRVVTAEVVH